MAIDKNNSFKGTLVMENKRTIFIVDDDADDRLFIKRALEENIGNIEIVEIPGGEEMYEWLKNWIPDSGLRLILMDMNMPRLNGLELLTVIKQNVKWKHVPVVMISTTSSTDLVNKAYDLGVNAFITKPIDLIDYDRLAHTIGLCFLNNFPETKPLNIRKARIRSVIIIEDNDDHWVLTDFSLKRVVPGIQTIRLKDKADSIAFFNNEFKMLHVSPDFILLDLYLPERQDGLELLTEIRNLTSRNEVITIPVIVFSHSNSPDDANASLFGQANAYLVKPTDEKQWTSYFEYLCNFMSHTISLPKTS